MKKTIFTFLLFLLIGCSNTNYQHTKNAKNSTYSINAEFPIHNMIKTLSLYDEINISKIREVIRNTSNDQIDIRDQDGKRPLQLLIEKHFLSEKKIDIIYLLIEKGADIDVPDCRGSSFMDLYLLSDHIYTDGFDNIKMIISHSNNINSFADQYNNRINNLNFSDYFKSEEKTKYKNLLQDSFYLKIETVTPKYINNKVTYSIKFNYPISKQSVSEGLKVVDSENKDIPFKYYQNDLYFDLEISNFKWDKQYFLLINSNLRDEKNRKISSYYRKNLKYDNIFKEIDDYAKNVPASETITIEKLTKYLSLKAKDDIFKARAIYIWIISNIKYDFFGLANDNIQFIDADDILVSRRSICMGYSYLFEKMATKIGLQCNIVNGYADNQIYKQKVLNIMSNNLSSANIYDSSTSHAWNIVKLNDEKYLIDSTWGIRYFLAPPAEFITNHFPYSAIDQLLEKTISFDSFTKLPLTYNLFTNGICLQSNISSIENITDNNFSICFKIPMDTKLSVIAHKYSDIAPLYKEVRINTVYSDDNIKYEVEFTNEGNYVLDFYVTRPNENKNARNYIEEKCFSIPIVYKKLK